METLKGGEPVAPDLSLKGERVLSPNRDQPIGLPQEPSVLRWGETNTALAGTLSGGKYIVLVPRRPPSDEGDSACPRGGPRQVEGTVLSLGQFPDCPCSCPRRGLQSGGGETEPILGSSQSDGEGKLNVSTSYRWGGAEDVQTGK